MVLKIEYRDVHRLLPYAKNSRTHSKEQVAKIAASIKEFGFTNPVLIDGEDGLIAGHGRVMAAKLLKMKQVPCIVLAHLSKEQKRAYVIADNKIALGSEWDMSALQSELIELADADLDLDSLGLMELMPAVQIEVGPLAEPESLSEAPKNESEKPDKQRMLVPVVLNFSNAEFAVWKAHRKLFDTNESAVLELLNAQTV